MICNHCEREINESAAFCPFCGTKVEKIEKNLFCTSCGNEIDEDSAFCSSCGSPIKKQEEKTEIAEINESGSDSIEEESNIKNDGKGNHLNYFILCTSIIAAIASCVSCYISWYY